MITLLRPMEVDYETLENMHLAVSGVRLPLCGTGEHEAHF